MLQGPNIEMVEVMVRDVACPIIASGGVSSALDLVRLNSVAGLSGAIIGKALFEGRIEGHLREAMAVASSPPGQ
jgi:phosphoribosylformimino-5-aminoimidazole carboxamide ribotide isomerase